VNYSIPELRRLVPLTAMVILLASGCGKRSDGDSPDGDTPLISSVPVEVTQVRPGKFTLDIDISGSTEAIREVNISARVGGNVESAPVELGDRVGKGDLLLQIDHRLFAAGVAQARAGLLAAEAAYKQASRELQRAQTLKDKGRISDAEFERAELGKLSTESTHLAARATLEQTELQLEYSEIRAPFPGLVALKTVEVGELVAPGMPVTAVVDLSGILIRAGLSEQEIVRVRVGMEVDIRIPALAEEHFLGRIRTLGVRSDPITRSYPVEVVIDNPEGRILSGMAARGGIIVEKLDQVITVPGDAVVEQYGKAVVFLVREGKALRREVQLGSRAGDLIVVTHGLEAGDRLITKGQWSVQDGLAVEIMN
jgi:RND family efflux transporter MFP subunit